MLQKVFHNFKRNTPQLREFKISFKLNISKNFKKESD